MEIWGRHFEQSIESIGSSSLGFCLNLVFLSCFFFFHFVFFFLFCFVLFCFFNEGPSFQIQKAYMVTVCYYPVLSPHLGPFQFVCIFSLKKQNTQA